MCVYLSFFFVSCRNWRCSKWRQIKNNIQQTHTKCEKDKRTRKYINLHVAYTSLLTANIAHCYYLVVCLLVGCIYLCICVMRLLFLFYMFTLYPVFWPCRGVFIYHHNKHIYIYKHRSLLTLVVVEIDTKWSTTRQCKFHLMLRCINRYKLRYEGIRFGMWTKYLLLFLWLVPCFIQLFHIRKVQQRVAIHNNKYAWLLTLHPILIL